MDEALDPVDPGEALAATMLAQDPEQEIYVQTLQDMVDSGELTIEGAEAELVIMQQAIEQAQILGPL